MGGREVWEEGREGGGGEREGEREGGTEEEREGGPVCFLLVLQLNQPEGRELRPHETTLATDLTRALDSLANQEKIRQPPPVTKPEELVTQEEGADGENPFIGEDAVRYMTGLALLRKKRKMEVDLESEKERKERQREIERRLREEMSRVENDGSLEEFIKNKRSQEGETEFARQMRYESSQLDITPLMKQVCMIRSMNHNSLGCKQPYITQAYRCKKGSHPIYY